MEFSRRLDRFGHEIFAELNEKKLLLEQQGRHIYNLSIGTPDFAPPEHIRRALAEAAMDPEQWKYSLRDLPELLEAVCDYYRRRFDVCIRPEQVMSCYGSQEGVGHLALALADEGDTVLLPDPCYPVFQAGALLAGAEPWCCRPSRLPRPWRPYAAAVCWNDKGRGLSLVDFTVFQDFSFLLLFFS